MPRSFYILAFIAAFGLGSVAARAEGTVVIQQSDGAIKTYPGAKIQIVAKTLTVTSADGEGTLIINRAACSYQGEIMMCLPDGATLVQSGSVKGIKLQRGTVYLNLTDSSQPLMLSAAPMPPHSILLSLKTKIGTYINVTGQIDKVAK